jgi:glycosyltransferase involved in cell wall biosynthesis
VTKVMQVIAGARHGGAEAFFMRLVPVLARTGIEQRVAIRRHETRSTRLRDAGLEPLALSFGGWFDFATDPKLARAIDDFAPDVVLAWMSRAARYCRQGEYALVGRLGGYYDLKYYRHCDHLIANTTDIANYLASNGWPRERTTYIPNFVDAKPAAAADREAEDTPTDAPLLLAMGRLHQNKAFDVLLDAMVSLPDAYLWIAGDGPLGDGLRQQAERLGIASRVRFLGWRDDVASLLAAADVLVCPSRHEPLGNVVIEGWAHRRPVVAAAAQGPSALIEDGRSGLIVPVGDAEALADAIRRAAFDGDLAAALADGGQAAYEADYTEAIVVDRYREFFATVAD